MTQTKYIKNLEKELGRRIIHENELYAELRDWIRACFNYKDLADRKDKLATELFVLGILLGGLLVESIILLSILK